MPEKSGICRRFARWSILGSCSLLGACGSSGGGGPTAAVLTESPHCPTGSDALKIEGTIAGAAIDDSRSVDINAGYENFSGGKFYTPFSTLVPLADNQIALTFEWSKSLLFGQTSAITSGSLTLPATQPEAGASYCISAGQVGFVDGGSEDGALKFAITELEAGADCSGPPLAVDLRGCDQ